MKRFLPVPLLVLLLSLPGFAGEKPQAIPLQIAVYAVKFVCGLQVPVALTPPREPPVKPGNYATAVNILNFHNLPVTICKKAVVAIPEKCIPGPSSAVECQRFLGVKVISLHPEEALEVDCDDIANLLAPAGTPLPPFIKGFVEVAVFPQIGLSSTNPLGVTGVYTAQECAPSPTTKCAGTGPVSIEVQPQNSQLGEIPAACVPR